MELKRGQLDGMRMAKGEVRVIEQLLDVAVKRNATQEQLDRLQAALAEARARSRAEFAIAMVEVDKERHPRLA